ncbi:uncharacterized protein EV154DRAFT_477110 [Mucor mucedo]|uniref:uncharacterized protein n=1 Tax=Mucor mucedo TaxID=29922 RepID=UPI002220A3A3|nr:uncharacterized protein EV154DRAFT_477110 [Mucor mucedo]KAI7895657.1 hypothetical protein EV154DRAFT_477110 [Mucor mucedo]
MYLNVTNTFLVFLSGESTCAASKFERQGHLSNDKNKDQAIEIAAMEIKPAGVNIETESILCCLRSHCGEDSDDSLFTIGMDVIVKQFEDLVIATKAHEVNMFLLADATGAHSN